MKVIVVGSGIAGLSTAIALLKVGIDVVVYERSPELREVGAGISLWYNALRALETMGAADAIRQHAIRMTHSELRLSDGHVELTKLDALKLADELGVPELVCMIHRADLVAALASHLPSDVARYGFECVSVEDAGDRAIARFANGHQDSSDVILGADGIHSVVREAILGRHAARYAGYTCWRGVCKRPEIIEPGYIAEWWGTGSRVGITTLPLDRVYWWAVKNESANGRQADEKQYLLQTFGDWAAPVREMLESTPAEKLLRNDILDRPPQRGWSRGRLGLLGDAAHPTTPNFGQGGCMAIEDAVVVARQLAKINSATNEVTPDNIATALTAFENERFDRTSRIVNDSWRFGYLAQRQSWYGVMLRDLMLRMLLRLSGNRGLLKYTSYDVGHL